MIRYSALVVVFALASSSALAQNLLPNADFDIDVAGWTPETAFEQATWDADDFEGSAQSGSLLLTFPGALGARRARACVSLGVARDYILSAWMRVPADVEQGSISTFGFTSDDCSSGFQGFSGGTGLFPMTDIWSFEEVQFTVPADTMSLEVDLGASDPTAGTYTVRFDSLFLPEPASGLTCFAALASLTFLSRRRALGTRRGR